MRWRKPTQSLLDRPGTFGSEPQDAARLMTARFDEPAMLDARASADVPAQLAATGVAGGAVYDALVALAAKAHDLPLATRDARAASTYARLDVEVISVLSAG